MWFVPLKYEINYLKVSCKNYPYQEHGDRERISKGGVNLIKTQYIQA
jgi:hypothetical protein